MNEKSVLIKKISDEISKMLIVNPDALVELSGKIVEIVYKYLAQSAKLQSPEITFNDRVNDLASLHQNLCELVSFEMTKNNERHTRQVDENRKISRRVDELDQQRGGHEARIYHLENKLEDKIQTALKDHEIGLLSHHDSWLRMIERLDKLEQAVHQPLHDNPLHHMQSMHKDHYANYEHMKKELQLVVQAQDSLYERMDEYEKMEWTSTPLNNLAAQYCNLSNAVKEMRDTLHITEKRLCELELKFIPKTFTVDDLNALSQRFPK